MEEEEAMNAQEHSEDEGIVDDLNTPHGRGQKLCLNRRTVRKLDFILLPFLALLFLLNSLDKSNVGNAETAGFTHDAGLSAGDLNLSMAFFFAFFVALQPIGAALGRKYGMARWVPACMSLWGMCTVLHIWVNKPWQLTCLRIAIASLEAGFYPTTVSYLSLFYTRYEFAVRLGFFYGQSAVAGALGGVLSWAIFNRFPKPIKGPQPPPRDVDVPFRDGGSQWKAWEVLFLIEGCTTMLVAMIGFLWLPHSAETAWFLNARERQWAEKRIHLDLDDTEPSDMRRPSKAGSGSGTADEDHPPVDSSNFPDQDLDSSDGEAHDRLLDGRPTTCRRKASTVSTKSLTADSGLTRQDILSAFLNYKIWHLLVCNILSAIPATAFGVFLPLVIKQLSPSLKFSPAQSNLLTAPPFLCGAVVLWMFMYWSDRSRQRIVPILYGLGLLLIGLTATILSGQERYILRYLSLCVLISGSFIASPLSVAWLTNNTPEPGKRAILLGINGWGNLAGVFSSLLFTPDQDESGYVRPFLVTLVCVLAAFVGYIAFWILLFRENRWRDQFTATWDEEERQREERSGDVYIRASEVGWGGRTVAKLRSLLGESAPMEGRRGDGKMTFRYSL
ncbi:MFS general substrate transporter [Hortaea werneckii]|uniref:Major facilitator superfamily (MFS) profile domain-containing protein n=2 Tax=Hortaea werneckii TaxID=91943 RepID=A0A3M7ILD4_HORWE|nr:MFS general substrate transporter [Hortaea werneckii]OTA36167.1 hypothetical protein BTJ68_03395 [Hortaea werneckii EXF-2000]KAI6834378.1 MFS general substrate transporter [Hortaea werneckii]KAI6846724.1 MFS general substrate transporter [Hortaea werneckii]KAI6939030.1 MFS general substrate transporter [Hortaea werneckii]